MSTTPSQENSGAGQPSGSFLPKGAKVALAAVLTVAFTGYFVGLRESRQTSQAKRSVAAEHVRPKGEEARAPEAVSYSMLPLKKLGPNSGWSSSLATIAQPMPTPPPKAPASAAERKKCLEERGARRAFDGAPPIIPHPTSQMSSAACMACHEKGLVIGDKTARMMSHPFYASCTQCHVEAAGDSLVSSREKEAGSEEGSTYQPPVRAFLGAPTPLPHPIWMRENCLSCHGPSGTQPLRTTHPERVSCLQCHAPNSWLDLAPSVPRGDLP